MYAVSERVRKAPIVIHRSMNVGENITDNVSVVADMKNKVTVGAEGEETLI